MEHLSMALRALFKNKGDVIPRANMLLFVCKIVARSL